MKQIPFHRYHEFFPNKSRRELIELYSITEGVPKYIEKFSEGGDIFRELERKADSVGWRKEARQVWYVLFSALGFTGELKEIAAEREGLLLLDELNFKREPSEDKNQTE